MKDDFFMLRRRVWKGIFRAAVNPSLEAAGKTCEAMQSCIAASRGSPSLANPLGACAEPLFFTIRKMRCSPGLLPVFSSFLNNSAQQSALAKPAHVIREPLDWRTPGIPQLALGL